MSDCVAGEGYAWTSPSAQDGFLQTAPLQGQSLQLVLPVMCRKQYSVSTADSLIMHSPDCSPAHTSCMHIDAHGSMLNVANVSLAHGLAVHDMIKAQTHAHTQTQA